jgi:hypothetical protein
MPRKQAPRVEFSQAKFDEICSLIADGKSVRTICEMDGMPNRCTFNEWRKRTPELQAQYDQAYIDYENSVLDDIVYIADTEPDPRKAAVRMDARKWDLKIRNRKRFGDKVEAELTGKDGGPIVVAASPLDERL